MVLPPVEETPLIAVRFAASTPKRLIDLVEKRLVQGGLISLTRRGDDNNNGFGVASQERHRTVLHLTSTHKVLEEFAEHIHLMKQLTSTHIMERFTVVDRKRFRQSHHSRWSGKKYGVIDTDHRTTLNLDEHGLFNSNEWSLLAMRILDTITVLDATEATSELSQILDRDFHADYYVHSYDNNSSNSSGSHFGTFREFTSSFRRTLSKHGEQSACLRHVLETYKIVDLVTSIHQPKICQEILDRTWWPWYQLTPPLDDIHNYYGWEISFYFAWMGFLSQWLLFPGIVGVLFLVLRWYRKDTIDEDEYTPFYGLITFLWGVLFLRFWQRHEHRLAYQWGTESLSTYERQKFISTRPDFRGFVRKSPVTGSSETYYPPIRRRLKYLWSATVTIAMLQVAFTVMILSLNLQGYIHPQKNPKRWDDSNPHPFHVRSLAVLAEEGRLFDAKSTWRSMLPVVLHVSCIFTLNSIYRVIAGALTAWENHETTLDHRNSLILKRFLFEAFDCYVALFYLAFYERDVDKLRLELMNVFQIDTLRRVLLECIVPMLIQRIVAYRSRRKSRMSTSSELAPLTNRVTPTEAFLMDDLEKDSYEQFDDYMEIVIQLGYVTLFASAYPLASLISIVANWVEIRSDCFKLSKLCRRPDSFRTSGLGMWRGLMASIIWMSALTNCLIAGFTSSQLTHYLPAFYIRDDDGNSIDHEDGWLVVFVIFGLERLLLVAGLLVFAIVPAVPEDVTDQLERREFIRSQQRILDAAALADNKKHD